MNPLNKILLGVGAGVVLVIAVVILWLCFSNAHLRTALAKAEANSTACAVANDDFSKKAEQQNLAILALKTAAEAETRHAEAAMKAAEKTSAHYQADADHLAQQKNSGDDCKAAAALLDHFFAEVP